MGSEYTNHALSVNNVHCCAAYSITQSHPRQPDWIRNEGKRQENTLWEKYLTVALYKQTLIRVQTVLIVVEVSVMIDTLYNDLITRWCCSLSTLSHHKAEYEQRCQQLAVDKNTVHMKLQLLQATLTQLRQQLQQHVSVAQWLTHTGSNVTTVGKLLTHIKLYNVLVANA